MCQVCWLETEPEPRLSTTPALERSKKFFYHAKFRMVKITKFREISRNFCDEIKFLTGRGLFLNTLAFRCHQKENFFVKNPYIFVKIRIRFFLKGIRGSGP
jgi:hypothetical protein